MNITHTLYLDLCYFLYCMFPLGISILTGSSQNKKINPITALGRWTLVANYMIIPYYIYYGGSTPIQYSSFFVTILTVIVGVILTLGIELLLVYIVSKRITVQHAFSTLNAGVVLGLIQIVIFEELIFRSILLGLLWKYTHSHVITLLITSFCYSLNHYFLGLWSCITKFLWGAVLYIILWYTQNFVVVCAIHIINDILIILLSKYLNQNPPKDLYRSKGAST